VNDIHHIKKPTPLIPGGSLSEQVEENPRGNQITKVHREKKAVKWK